MSERVRVLDLLESGKITADEAVKLLDALGQGGKKFIDQETKENIEEKLHQFAKDVNCFAKDVGCKMQDFYKEVEPKVKKASQTALEKAAAVLDNLAQSINDSMEKGAENGCCGKPDCTCDDDAPKPN